MSPSPLQPSFLQTRNKDMLKLFGFLRIRVDLLQSNVLSGYNARNKFYTELSAFHTHGKTLQNSIFTIIESYIRFFTAGIHSRIQDTCYNILSVINSKKGIYFQSFELPNAVVLYSLVKLNGKLHTGIIYIKRCIL